MGSSTCICVVQWIHVGSFRVRWWTCHLFDRQESFDELKTFFFFLQSITDGTEFNEGRWNHIRLICQNKRTCLRVILHRLVGLCWLNTSHTSLRWSCHWSELSNNWLLCSLGWLLHFVFWLIGSVYTSAPASRLPTLVWNISKWTIWSSREDTHEITISVYFSCNTQHVM